MHGIRFMPQGIRWATIAGIFFIAGACELTRAQARPDSPPVTMKPSATDQNAQAESELRAGIALTLDRKSTRLNSSHSQISYAVFCLKKKKKSRTCQSRLIAALRHLTA